MRTHVTDDDTLEAPVMARVHNVRIRTEDDYPLITARFHAVIILKASGEINSQGSSHGGPLAVEGHVETLPGRRASEESERH
jgi:hypothetical protein